MWGATLSGPLPVVGLVRLYRTNYLMGRSPVLKWLAPLLSALSLRPDYAVLARLSARYPALEGRSATCYSPVRHSNASENASPFDLHVLSTPPAFILSQDQTLRQLRWLFRLHTSVVKVPATSDADARSSARPSTL